MRSPSSPSSRSEIRAHIGSNDVPDVLGRVTELATGDAGTETVIAKTDLVVDERVGKVVMTFGHGADEDADALVGGQVSDVVPHPYDGGVVAERHLPTARRQVIGDGVLNDLEKLLRRFGRPNGQSMQQLHHETSEAFKGPWNAHGWANLDQDPLSRVNINLKLAGLVDGRVQQGQQTLDGSSTGDRMSA